ncbi:Rne/Rng family ribonuclease, partial [Streptomyces sp. YIM 98790]|uniref:Rne/Rng family ribonuclease n=1 Tax=Streptomyces sp. YIM 98790 TaxID=2689077 RepID=UPI001FB6E6FE
GPRATREAEAAEESGTGTRRTRRRAVAPQVPAFAEPDTGEAGSEPAAAPPMGGPVAGPPAALFQAPVFQAPMFQTPERAAEEAALAREEEPEPEPEPEAEEAEAGAGAEPEEGAGQAAEEPAERGGRRRRRGGRRRRRSETAERAAERFAEEEAQAGAGARAADETAEREEGAGQAAAEEPGTPATGAADEGGEADEADEADEEAGGSRRRRRRRRRRGEAAAEGEPSTDDPERTVIKVREPRRKEEAAEAHDGVQSIKGSTRLEAKKQRRREGREQGRRRVPILTEAEFLARRESVERVMVVRQSGERTQIGVLEDSVLVEHYVNKEQAHSYVGNVYLGKVQNVLPSMEAAFVDIGKGRNAVLYAGEVNFEALGLSGGPRRIETALKSGQSVLVQVTKDPMGHKGARLTSQISLPGRYLVYVPEGSMTGISRKLPDTERTRLKQILKKIVPDNAGVIVRTAAEGASEEELTRDVARLQKLWEDIRKKARKGNAPSLLYGEPDMTVRVVRDIFNEDFSKVIVSGDTAWETVHGYVSQVAPDLADRLQRWTSEVDVFATYRIDEQLMKALDRKVWLPSGGSLVIDRTEAMVVIDVNTGRFTGQGGNLEETVTRNNLEAAEEIVRQLRLRDLGGIIVIDFIDMVLESNRELVLRRLLECLGRDRTKHQVAEVTSLGLVQMTRKRVGQGLLESFSEPCVHCNGRGVIVHMDQLHAAPAGKKARKKQRQAEQRAAEEAAAQAAAEAAEEEAGAEEAVEEAEEAPEAAEPAPVEAAAEEAAEAALEFAPDEELYSSVAEAEESIRRGGRRRRRVTRKVTAPAGAPRGGAEAAVVVVTPEPVPEARPEPVTGPETEPVREPEAGPETGAGEEAPEPAAPRRRRVVRRVSAPAAEEPAEEPAEPAEPPAEAGAEAEPEEPEAARKAARSTAKKAAKKAAAKKTAAKKTAAKKTAAKKTAKKAAAKKSTKKATAAAEQQALPSVTASAED